ncbi:MAG: YcnI family copper-binding membrane protein [Acidimicrobiales bacterium]
MTLSLVALGAAVASPASAHVTVHPDTLPAASSEQELTFRVPNERDDASTTMLQVFFPGTIALDDVSVLPVPGWRVIVGNGEVTWSATGGGIAPGQYEDFPVAVDSLPSRPGRLVFKALQTYSSGEVVRWIEISTPGAPEPTNPAPVLTLTAQAANGGTTRSGSGGDALFEALAVGSLVLSIASLGTLLWTIRHRRAR